MSAQPTPTPFSPASFDATHVVFDLASLKFRPSGTQMVVLSPMGEHLGSGPIGPNGNKEACLAALDDAAARTRLWRYDSKVGVGFYNPFTAEISLGPSFDCQVFALPTPVGFSAGGLLVRSSDDRLVLQTGAVAPVRPTPTLDHLSRLLITTRDSVRSQ